MSRARLVITAVVVENRSVAEVVAEYGMSRSQIYALVARYRAQGESAFEARSRRPHSSPTATPAATVELIVRLRKELAEQGLDAGADTIGWHLTHHHQITTRSRFRGPPSTGSWSDTALSPQTPRNDPSPATYGSRPEQPNETWQSDFTHYRLTNPDGTPGRDVEIITWLDDHSRYLLHISAHLRITGPIVVATFTQAAQQHGYPRRR